MGEMGALIRPKQEMGVQHILLRVIVSVLIIDNAEAFTSLMARGFCTFPLTRSWPIGVGSASRSQLDRGAWSYSVKYSRSTSPKCKARNTIEMVGDAGRENLDAQHAKILAHAADRTPIYDCYEDEPKQSLPQVYAHALRPLSQILFDYCTQMLIIVRFSILLRFVSLALPAARSARWAFRHDPRFQRRNRVSLSHAGAWSFDCTFRSSKRFISAPP